MNDDNISQLEAENNLLREQIRKIQNRLEEKISELSMIREIGMTLLYISSFKESCRFILDVIINSTIAQNCSIMLLDPKIDQLFLIGASDSNQNHYILDTNRIFSLEGTIYSFKVGEGAAGQAFQERKPIYLSNAQESPLFIQLPESQIEINSLITIPLLIENKPIGVLNLSHSKRDAFDKNDIHLFDIIANFVAVAIHSSLNTATLEFSEAKYRALVENSNDGVAIIQAEKHAYANPKYLELTGYTQDELADIAAEKILKERTVAWTILQLLDKRAGEVEFEAELVSRSSILIPVGINAAALTYEGKNSAIISVRDLSQRKKIEKQLRHSQKMETIGTLAGSVAHDLNNILTGIVSYPELLLMELPEASPLRNPLKTIQKSGEKAAAIVQDLLALARRGVVISKVINLNEILRNYLGSAEHQKIMSYYPQINLQTHLDEELLNSVGSPIHLSRILMNLIANAAEAIGGDEGKIVITTANLYLERPLPGNTTIKEGEYATLAITDTGIGIPMADINKIFEPFFTKKRMGRSGTGLGLAVVMGIVNDHEGYIDVQSTEGAGTIFTLYLPAVRQSIAVEQSMELTFDSLRGNGQSILVVDDVLEQRQISLDLLSRLGYKVVAVASGEEAIRYLLKNKADLLILDMIMEPGLNGLETYREISKTNPKQKALIVSGYSETEQVAELQRLGAGAYIKKPYTLETLAKAVQAELAA